MAGAIAHFTAHLPYRMRCSDDLDRGLSWAPRPVALLHAEIAPDPPGWRTALRFDVDCPCAGGPHVRGGYCARAAAHWTEVGLPEPSFVTVNPSNGHAHYTYLLRGWVRIDGADVAQLHAVRYLAAIERAYTRALGADPGYAGLVIHNPLNLMYDTVAGRAEPYSLGELSAHVELPTTPRRREPEIRCEGRNVETFDRLRFWAYGAVGEWRCGAYDDWLTAVETRAGALAERVRPAYPAASHAFSDTEVRSIAKSVAGWVWLRYDGANPIVAAARAALRRARDRARDEAARRERGAVTRAEYLAAAQERRAAAARLAGMGVAIAEIARRLSAGIRSVYRWLSELRSMPSSSTLSDFKPQSVAQKKNRLGVFDSNRSDGAFAPSLNSSHGTSAGSPAGCRGEYELAARSAGKVFSLEPARIPSVDLLAYARQRLAKKEPTQADLFRTSSVATLKLSSAELEDGSPIATASRPPVQAGPYSSPLSAIQRRIAEIAAEADRRRETPSDTG
jgi:hypothetical protein